MDEQMRQAAQAAGEPNIPWWVNYLWLWFLIMLGGTAKYLQDINSKHMKHSLTRFGAVIVTSLLSGLLTSQLCAAAHMSFHFTSALSGLSGWMGVEALKKLEALWDRAMGATGENNK